VPENTETFRRPYPCVAARREAVTAHNRVIARQEVFTRIVQKQRTIQVVNKRIHRHVLRNGIHHGVGYRDLKIGQMRQQLSVALFRQMMFQHGFSELVGQMVRVRGGRCRATDLEH
jgi:hypothetical protein